MKRVLLPLMLLAVGSLAVLVWHQTSGEADSPSHTRTVGQGREDGASGVMTGDPGLPAAGNANHPDDDHPNDTHPGGEATRQVLPTEAAATPTIRVR